MKTSKSYALPPLRYRRRDQYFVTGYLLRTSPANRAQNALQAAATPRRFTTQSREKSFLLFEGSTGDAAQSTRQAYRRRRLPLPLCPRCHDHLLSRDSCRRVFPAGCYKHELDDVDTHGFSGPTMAQQSLSFVICRVFIPPHFLQLQIHLITL